MRFHRLIAGCAQPAVLPACAVGPNFKRPTPPERGRLRQRARKRRTAAAESAGGDAQRFVAGMDIPSQWWTLFKSPQLDRLVEQALKANPDVGAAQAALRQAHELYLAQRTSFFPVVEGNFSGHSSQERAGDHRQPDQPSAIESLLQSLYRPAHRELPARCFGATRRAVEAAKAQAQANRFQLEAST